MEVVEVVFFKTGGVVDFGICDEAVWLGSITRKLARVRLFGLPPPPREG